MNAKLIWAIIAGIGALLGIGGTAVAYDQYEKRKGEEAGFRNSLNELEAKLKAKESEFAELKARLGEKNRQVRELSEEIARLRAEIETKKRAA
jgi:peptidoglycan hydrolase CwlO-like protein